MVKDEKIIFYPRFLLGTFYVEPITNCFTILLIKY